MAQWQIGQVPVPPNEAVRALASLHPPRRRIVGHDPDAYHMIGVEHRIPEPTPEARAKCVQRLLDAGSSQEAVETGLATLGVPPGASSAQTETLSRRNGRRTVPGMPRP